MLTNIGLVYDSLGETSEGLRYFLEALPLRQKVGDPRGIATTLTCIGKAHIDLGDQEQARADYTSALSLSRTANDPRGQAIALTRLGSLEELTGNLRKALEYQTQALELRRPLKDSVGIAHVLIRIGTIHTSLGDIEKGYGFYSEALPFSRAAQDPTMEAEVLHRLAEAKRDQGDLDAARKLVEGALALVESVRAKVGTPDLRASYLATTRESSELYVELLMRLHERNPAEGFDALALAAAERTRARSLLDLLTEARNRIRQGVDPSLLDRERSLKQLLNAKLERQTRLLTGKHSDEQAAQTAKEIDALTTEYEQLEARIRATSPRYAALTQPTSLGAEEIQRLVLDDDTLLLEYALGKERSFLWAVTQDSVSSYELPKRSEIDLAARSVYEQVRAHPAGNGALQKSEAAAATLSAMVLEPAAGLLSRKRIVIVSEGALQFVPFGVLPSPAAHAAAARPNPLIVDHEVVSLPSASALAVLRREHLGRQPAPKALAVIADPVFERDDARVRGNRSKVGARPAGAGAAALEKDLVQSVRDIGIGDGVRGIPRLLFTRREAEAILVLAPPAQRKGALDFDASLATATSTDLSQYRFIHFATHGLLNSTHPGLSGIVLSLVDREGREKPGFLPALDVFNLNLPAELVVLSACRTALGKEVRGEGLVGLTRAFMYAGAPRVVASLWTVDDAATAELMRRFYQAMLGPEHLPPAAALRAAQAALAKQERWAHPYYWGAFVLQGEWN